MIVLDFLFYYLTYWFDKNKDKLNWSTAIERSAYVVGLMTMGLLYSINECFELLKIKSPQFHIPWFVYLICALAVIKLYDYIYITRNRYQRITTEIPNKIHISDDTGAMICITIAALLILSPFIITTILVPFGSAGGGK
jgi:hypothetical protein